MKESSGWNFIEERDSSPSIAESISGRIPMFDIVIV